MEVRERSLEHEKIMAPSTLTVKSVKDVVLSSKNTRTCKVRWTTTVFVGGDELSVWFNKAWSRRGKPFAVIAMERGPFSTTRKRQSALTLI